MKDQLNCPNCGAPIAGLKCEYCGTQFFDIADIEVNKPGYLRMKLEESINTFKAIPTYVNITVERNEPVMFYSDDNPVAVAYYRPPEITVDIEFKVLIDEEGIYWRKKKL